MKHIIFRKKLIAILSAMILVASCPIVAMADNDYSSSSTIKTETSKETSRMTSSDWAELQSQVEAEISSQNAEQSDKKSSNENSKGGSFKDFKDGKYVGNGEWLLVIGIILIVLGVAGIGFVVIMMLRRKKISQRANSKQYSVKSQRRPPNKSDGSSGRRIAPKK